MVVRPSSGEETWNPIADRRLAAAAAAGEERALAELLSRHSRRLLRVAYTMTWDRDEAQDLCQEALVRIGSPRVLNGYRGDGPLDGYLQRVGVRAMVSRRRTGAAARALTDVVGDVPDGAAVGPPEVGGLSPGLREALEALPERARLVIVLIVLADFSYEEVADTVGLELGTVKSTYSRARAALRARLEPEVELHVLGSPTDGALAAAIDAELPDRAAEDAAAAALARLVG
jgi:DNA-directed RNA polymerase specialized sigma24 family protein